MSLGGTPNRVAILLSNGDGTFRHGDVYSGLADYLAVGDFNGNGIPDLAMSWSLPAIKPSSGRTILCCRRSQVSRVICRRSVSVQANLCVRLRSHSVNGLVRIVFCFANR